MRHLLGLREISSERLLQLLERASDLRTEVEGHQNRRLDLLRGKAVSLLFVEPSTRTRFSFEMACRRLGAEPLVFSASNSSTSKGETLIDTARVLERVGADALVLRHKGVGAPTQLAEALGIPVINAGDGINEHPTQGLLDLLTIRDHFPDFNGLTVGIVGDVLHSRVARSATFGLKKLGARVLFAGPGTLCSPQLTSLGAEVRHTIDEVVEEVDVLMMLRIQRERLGASMLASEREYRHFWGLTASRASRMRDHAIVLHPAPMNRGVEIDDDVADGPRSRIFSQMANGVYARMAVLLDVLEIK